MRPEIAPTRWTRGTNRKPPSVDFDMRSRPMALTTVR